MKFSIRALVLLGSIAVAFAEPSLWDTLEGIEDLLPEGFVEKEAVSSRIIGGETATPGQFKYQAGLLMNKTTSSSWCGGVLVSESYVLTAAHCAINAAYIDVYLGAQNIRNLTEVGRLNIRVFSENITVHKAYSSSTISNDIAILRLPQPVKTTSQIEPINLPSYSDAAIDFAGSSVVISGWGKNANDAQTITDQLQFTGVSVQPQSVCQYYFRSARSSNICTDTVFGRGTCNGDSGGPVALNRADGPVLLGLTSFGSSRGCVACFPSVFVRVTYFLDWIAANSNIQIKL